MGGGGGGSPPLLSAPPLLPLLLVHLPSRFSARREGSPNCPLPALFPAPWLSRAREVVWSPAQGGGKAPPRRGRGGYGSTAAEEGGRNSHREATRHRQPGQGRQQGRSLHPTAGLPQSPCRTRLPHHSPLLCPSPLPVTCLRPPSSQHPPLARPRAPPIQKHGGRRGRRVGSPFGKAGPSGWVLGREAPWRRARRRRTRRGKFAVAPGECRAHPAPAGSERPAHRRWFISEVTPRRPRRSSEAERPREGVPATPSVPPPPTGAPWAQPARRPPGPAPSRRRADWGSGRRLRGKEASRQDRAPRTPWLCGRRAPGSAAPLRAARAPPAYPAPRGLRGEGVPRSTSPPTPQRRSLSAPRKPRRGCAANPQPPAVVVRQGTPIGQIPWPLSPGPRARSPGPAVSNNSGGTRLPGDGGRAESASRRAELWAATADLKQPRDAPRVFFGQSSLHLLPTRPAAHTPAQLSTAAPRCPGGSTLLPTAGGFAGRGSRLDAAVRAARAGEARESFSGRVRAPPAPRTAPRCSGFQAARAGGGNLPEELRRAKAAPGGCRSPRSSSPPRRAPAPALPEPGARSPLLVTAAIAPLHGPRTSSPAAARSSRPVRPPASQPPAPLFRALRTAGEAARSPRGGPARRPAPALAGLTRALKAPRPLRRARTPPLRLHRAAEQGQGVWSPSPSWPKGPRTLRLLGKVCVCGGARVRGTRG